MPRRISKRRASAEMVNKSLFARCPHATRYHIGTAWN